MSYLTAAVAKALERGGGIEVWVGLLDSSGHEIVRRTCWDGKEDLRIEHIPVNTTVIGITVSESPVGPFDVEYGIYEYYRSGGDYIVHKIILT